MKALVALILLVGVIAADEFPAGVYPGSDADKAARTVVVEKPKPAASHQTNAGLHSHLCPKCGHEWWHGDEKFGHAPSHTCPKCGTMQWTINRKGSPPATPAAAAPLPIPVFKSAGGCPGGVCPTPMRRRGR